MKWSGWSEFPIEMRTADLEPLGNREGLHLSSVLNRIKVALGEKVTPIDGDQENVRPQEGFLWETALEYHIAGMSMDDSIDLAFKRYMVALRTGIVKQVKVVRDEIRMTPDGFNHTLGEVESYKHTRRSLRNARDQAEFENNFWYWLMQEKSYCYALGVDTARWIVLWAAGDYSKGWGSGPRVLQSVATFTPQELVGNWQVVLKHAEAMRG